MLSSKTFVAVLKAATELDPFGKRLSDETIALTYMTLPDQVKANVTDDMLVYALKQHHLKQPCRSELNLVQQLLEHVFSCENGAPNYDWGLKKDLPARMAKPGVLHGQPQSPYELGEDLGQKETRLAPHGVLNLLKGDA